MSKRFTGKMQHNATGKVYTSEWEIVQRGSNIFMAVGFKGHNNK